MNKQGYEWKDFAIAGGAGAAAMTALKTQVISGNAPSAAQIKGPLIQDWADQGVLVDIDQVRHRLESPTASANRQDHEVRRSLCGRAILGAPNQLAVDQQSRPR